MSSISLMQWKKSYMLEFLNGNTLVDCFTFSVPPESEELQFSQRISETKTFGGSVFDDYGNDTINITLSGTTINEDKKLIYKGTSQAPQYLTGTKEIFELQKIIKNWGENKFSSGFFRDQTSPITMTDKKIYLYDLSKMSVLQIATGTATRNYWRVFIKDLKIKRDKNAPFTYNYTLEMFAVEDDTVAEKGLFADFADTVDSIQSVMDKIQTVVDITEGTTELINQVAVSCSNVKDCYETMQNTNLSSGTIALTVGSSLDIVSRIMGGDNESFYNATKNVLSAVSNFEDLGTASDNEKSAETKSTNTFTVIFESNGGSSVKSQTVEYCNTITMPENPTKENYGFLAWYSDRDLTEEYDFSSEVSSDITLYAAWVLEVATITYNSRNGSSVLLQNVSIGTTTTAPTPPTRDGYLFSQWCTDYNGTIPFDFNTPINNDIMLYAAWNEIITVIFESNGGTGIEPQILEIGGYATYPLTPIKDNYTFAYWCTDIELKNIFDFSTHLFTNITLYALYVQISNTVIFESNGGSSIESQRVVIGGYVPEPDNPTREGFDFMYWCDDITVTNEFKFTNTVINTNTTLYAKWSESTYFVSFDSDGGSNVEKQEVAYNTKAIFPSIPIKSGFIFEKWQTREEVQTDSTGSDYIYQEFNFSAPITEDITLYALWFGGSND